MARPPPTESPPLFAHTRSLTTTPPDDGWEGSQPKRTKRRGKPTKPTKEVSTMKQEVRTAFVAANAVTAAVRAAEAAVNLLEQAPNAWGLADEAYWLCRAAQEAAQNAADELDPEEALEDDMILYAFRTAMEAVEKACTVADELVSLAEAAGHEIRR